MKTVNTVNSVNNVSETRERMHLELALAVAQFEMTHKVTVLKPQKNKVSRGVRAKEKLVFKSKTPVNRPCVMFDNVPLVV